MARPPAVLCLATKVVTESKLPAQLQFLAAITALESPRTTSPVSAWATQQDLVAKPENPRITLNIVSVIVIVTQNTPVLI